MSRLWRQATRPQRFLVTVGGRTIHDLGTMAFDELIAFLNGVTIPEKASQGRYRRS